MLKSVYKSSEVCVKTIKFDSYETYLSVFSESDINAKENDTMVFI